MFDGSVQTFEKVYREYTSLVLAIQDDKILLIYQRQPQKPDWYRDLLGGRVPRGVDMLKQAKKELREEAGMIAGDRELLRNYTKSGYIDRDVHYYIARDMEVVGGQELDPGGEEIEVKAVSFEEFIDLVLSKQLSDLYLRSQIMEMKIEGNLEEFRKRLFR